MQTMCMQVCKRWNRASGDQRLWHAHYQHYYHDSDKNNLELANFGWKNVFKIWYVLLVVTSATLKLT